MSLNGCPASGGRVVVDDPADSRLDDFRDLSTADRRPDRPGGRGLVIAEGVVVVRRLLESGYPVRAVLGVARRLDELAGDLAGRDVPSLQVGAELMAGVVGFHLNRGVLATSDRVQFPPVPQVWAAAQTVAVLEGVNDHENLGSIFRNAAALGVGSVVLASGCADPLYRRSVRVSMGTVLQVPFARWDGDTAELLGLLRGEGFTVAALTPDPTAITLARWASGIEAGATRVALVLGAEGPGLTDQAMAAADVRVRIPMADGVDSLNVATAGAVVFATLGDRR